MSLTTERLHWLPLDVLARFAYIAGPCSGAQAAMDELLRRRMEGEDAECYSVERPRRGEPNYVVGPRIHERQSSLEAKEIA